MMEIVRFSMEGLHLENGTLYVIRGADILITYEGKTADEAVTNLCKELRDYFARDPLAEIPHIELTYELKMK